MADKKDYVGVDDAYRNAANKTDEPRYGKGEREEYEKFGKTPEPEAARFGEKLKEEKKEVKPEPAKAPATPATPKA